MTGRKPRSLARRRAVPAQGHVGAVATGLRKVLGQSERSLVSELLDARNRWAHQEAFSTDDAYAPSTPCSACSPPSRPRRPTSSRQSKQELLRIRYEEYSAPQVQAADGDALRDADAGGTKPWREVVTAARRRASGRYKQAEFAADLIRSTRQRRRRVPRPGRVLPPHVPHRGPHAAACSGDRALTRQGRRSRSSTCRPTSAAARRTRCWRSTTCSRGRRRASCPASIRCS